MRTTTRQPQITILDGIRLTARCAAVSTPLSLPLAGCGVRAGFPSPAEDYIAESIDLNRDLIHHPASTFFARVEGDSMSGEGITEGDLLVIDRSLEPGDGDLAVCCLDGEFTLKRLKWTAAGRLYLMPSNPAYRPIAVENHSQFAVWGVVVYTIKSNRRRRG